MCGICGFVSLDPIREDSQSVLRRMCQTLRHRGPDDEGYYHGKFARLGMRRLSIIDLETGQQPLTNENGTVWLIFNGEIYNYRQLRADLVRRGHSFTTQSDSEVIIHAYEEFGTQCLNHFNGMFAFALWDSAARRLFLARDRLGIKPLFYWASKEGIVFGSELKAILAHPAVPREMDVFALDSFLSFEYIPTPRTIFKDIYKLPAGHWLILDDGGLQLEQYWDVPIIETPGEIEECTEHLVALIDDAVRLRLISDVPLGALLSGGIDSSTIVASMSRTSSEPVQTFSIGFDDTTYNELPSARLVAQIFETKHREEILEPDIVELIHELVGKLDEPFGDFSIFPTFLVFKLARASVKVVLSGDGGDEILGGYETYVAQNLDRVYRMLPRLMRQRALPAIMNRLPPQPEKKGLINKTKRFVEGAALPESLMHVRWMMFMNETDKASLYRPELTTALNGWTPASIFESHFQKAKSFDVLASQQYVDLKTYLVDDILTKVDRMSMAVSLEARVPLLDHRIVEFALNLPPEMKLNRRQTKKILRQAMAKRLPPEVLEKPKQGFSIPIKHWLRGPLRPLVMDLLSPDNIKRRGYFNSETVDRWATEHLNRRANHSHRLWALMVFELWHRQIMDVSHAA
jgi:asparagine synthase (glutamine-hydrolysing)